MLVSGSSVRIGEPDLTELVKALRSVEHPAGTVMYSNGSRPQGLWIIRRGCIEVSEGSGPSRSVVTVFQAGDVLGDIYILLDKPPLFTARCVERTECWYLSADEFRRLLATYPSLAIAWLCSLADRLSRARTRLGQVLGRTLRERLARVLLEEAVDGVLHLPQRTIAQMLGVQRTSVNKTLKELERRGFVHLAYATVTIIDPGALEGIALNGGGSSNGSPRDPEAEVHSFA